MMRLRQPIAKLSNEEKKRICVPKAKKHVSNNKFTTKTQAESLKKKYYSLFWEVEKQLHNQGLTSQSKKELEAFFKKIQKAYGDINFVRMTNFKYC